MKALTICQPYPYLILTPQAELLDGETQKRVENRTRNMHYRGPLLIHAGLSRKWLKSHLSLSLETFVFGAIVGIVDVVDCVPFIQDRYGHKKVPFECLPKYRWLFDHPHASGEYCIILENPRRFKEPIPYKGKLGLFNVPDELVKDAVIL